MTVTETAEVLSTSRQTVRTLLRSGELHGRKLPRGTRFEWRVGRKEVSDFLSTHGRLDGRRRSTSRLTQLERLVAQLHQQIATPTTSEDAPLSVGSVEVERDELRAQVVAFQEAFALVRFAAELQRRADAERAAIVQHLLEAAGAAERTDGLRREAIEALEEAVAAFSRPAGPGPV